MIFLDANVILRFLLADHPKHSPRARDLFEKAENEADGRLHLSHVCLAEVAWVLKSFYELDRTEISTKLKALLLHSGVACDDLDILLTALDNFGNINVDFIDCYNAAYTEAKQASLATFDKDYRRFPNLHLTEF